MRCPRVSVRGGILAPTTDLGEREPRPKRTGRLAAARLGPGERTGSAGSHAERRQQLVRAGLDLLSQGHGLLQVAGSLSFRRLAPHAVRFRETSLDAVERSGVHPLRELFRLREYVDAALDRCYGLRNAAGE